MTTVEERLDAIHRAKPNRARMDMPGATIFADLGENNEPASFEIYNEAGVVGYVSDVGRQMLFPVLCEFRRLWCAVEAVAQILREPTWEGAADFLDDIAGKIDQVRDTSTRYCSVCGEEIVIIDGGDWYRSLCDQHLDGSEDEEDEDEPE